MHNRAFYRALHSVLHPITIGAIVVLLLNDHFLKQHYPSWWTGKLSDFAGLIFSPLIFATFIAWVIPPRLKNQENWVGIIAFSVTGIIFALTKTLTQANDVTSKFWEFFAGGPVKMWLDPTDLLALPALIIGWLIWNRSSNHAMQVALPALTLIAIGSLAATATSCEGDPFEFSDGVFCISYFHESFGDMDPEYTLAINGGRFISEDRGETWHTPYNRYKLLQSHIPRCIYQNPYW
ncbi:MAG: hypothetical protein DPW16_15385 [Chloroflexi bacterium]|nr:hypothetical protein [Chloroflexota bacterium]